VFGAASNLVSAGTGLSEKEEIQVGREIAGRTLGAAPQSYVNRVGRWLALQSERPDLPWHFGVIDTVSINAFAAPGGYVLIMRGLYEILDKGAEFEADAVVVVVAARAGYSPYGRWPRCCISWRHAVAATPPSRCRSRPIPSPVSVCRSWARRLPRASIRPMARRPRSTIAGVPRHVAQCGNTRQAAFPAGDEGRGAWAQNRER